jgi:hypothetical protein
LANAAQPESDVGHRSSSSSSSCNNSIVGDAPADGVHAPDLAKAYPLRVGDLVFALEQHETPRRSYKRLVTTCLLHQNCKKRRNIGIDQTKLLGFFEPLAFLATWCDAAALHADHKMHNKHTPSVADMRSWLDQHPEFT